MKTLKSWKSLLTASLMLGLSVVATPSQAQSYPTHPITLVVPYPPGGSADILARTVGQHLGARLGQPVVIENKGGAGTAIGARFVADARPDGYTLLLGTVSSQAINPAMTKVGYNPVKDFVAISALASIPFVLVANPAEPYASVGELVAKAKKTPGVLSFASAGPGTSNHLAGEMLNSTAGIQLAHVPYRGSAPAMADVLAGHVPLMFDLQTTAIPNIAAGKVKALAVTGSARSSLLPQVPTVAESGLPGFEVSAWFGLFASAKVPEPTRKQLSAAMAEVLQMPDVTKRLRDIGADIDNRSPTAFEAYVSQEADKYAMMVKAAGLTP